MTVLRMPRHRFAGGLVAASLAAGTVVGLAPAARAAGIAEPFLITMTGDATSLVKGSSQTWRAGLDEAWVGISANDPVRRRSPP